MFEQVLAQASNAPDPWTGWLMGGIVALCCAISAMAVWYAKVREPAFTAQVQAIVMDSAKLLAKERDDFNSRLDAREAIYREDIRRQHEECRDERQARDAEMSAEIGKLQAALNDLTKVLQERMRAV